jgi:hypothetical protein
MLEYKNLDEVVISVELLFHMPCDVMEGVTFHSI